MALRASSLAAFASRPAVEAVEPEAAAAVEELEKTPGVKVEKFELGRVSVKFDLAKARKATEHLKHQDYVEKVAVSDNLRWSLSGGNGAATASEAPLGRASKVTGPTPSAPAGGD